MACAATTYSLEGLEERLAANCRLFDRLVNTIPAKYYVVTEGTVEHQNPKYQHNTRKRAPKQEMKEASHKAKKAKLDPENQKTVSDVQAELVRKKKEEESDRGLAPNGGSAGVEVGHTGPEANEEETAMEVDSTTVRPLPTLEAISELRQRVQKKIAALQEQRRNKTATPLSRDEILQERTRKKAEMKEKLRKQKKAGTGGGLGVAQKIVNSDDEGKIKTVSPSIPSVDAINDKSEIVFSKFVFEGEKSEKSGMDVRSALKKAEAKAEKIASIAADGPTQAAKIAEKNAWRRASQLARGDKPKDDVRLLKKTIRRSEQEKAKSAREWKERQDAVEAGITDRQRRREENIRARVEEKKAGRMGKKGKDKDKKKKKKKHRAGFEGR